jgi:hypothetical protein
MKNKKAVWKYIGAVGVDSGTLMIIDPCNARNFHSDDYKKYIIRMKNSIQIPFENGINCRAVAFSSGIGDGVYDVYAKFENLKDWGERITEVKIKMK